MAKTNRSTTRTRSTKRSTATARGARKGPRAPHGKARGGRGRTTARRPSSKVGGRGGTTVTLREKTSASSTATGTNKPNTIGGIPMRTVTPQLVVGDADAAIAWYAKVFGAKELDRKPLPDGRIMHAVLRLGDTAFMISDSFGPAPSELNGAFIHVQDKGVDAFWERALANGAKPILPLANQFWGDKYGQLRDPFGQIWSLGWPAKMTQAEKDRLKQEADAQMAAVPQGQ